MGKLQSGGTSTLVLCKNREFDLYVGEDTRGEKAGRMRFYWRILFPNG